MRQIVESGTISKDGKLMLPKDRLRQFGMENVGKRIIVTIEAVERGSSEAQLGYYWKYIIPTVREGLKDVGYRMTERGTDVWLREQLSDMITEGEVLEVEKLSTSQMSEYIEMLKQFCAENFAIYIEDARTL